MRAAGVRFRHFGLPMHLWLEAMPDGMYLKSQGFASNLSDPQGTHTLREFCRETGLTYADYGVPVHICDGMTARDVIGALAAGSPRMAA